MAIKRWTWACLIASMTAVAPARAAITIDPYQVDANTLHLYHFDESSGAFVDSVGTASLGDTGGINGRDGLSANGGGYGGSAYNGALGFSFDVLKSGTGTWHGGTSGNAQGGGATTSPTTIAQTNLQGADGAFTYEAVVRSSVDLMGPSTNERTILSHDGSTNRSFAFRVISGQLAFYNGTTSYASPSLPTTGANAFAVNEWFHVAVTYDGNAGVTGNLKFYWTRLGTDVTEANLLGTATLTSDLANVSNLLAVGTPGRSPYRFEWEGLIDEVRISDTARAAGDFLVVPEPASLALLVTGTMALAGRRRRRITG